MFQLTVGLLLISVFNVLSCKNSSKDKITVETAEECTNYLESFENFNSSKKENNFIDVKILDSFSLKMELPYGKKEIIDYDFPDHWYCGGGYLEGSLLQEGCASKDSIDYAQAYFSIIHFNREDNLASQPEIKSFNLGESISEINKILLKYNDSRITPSNPKVSAFIKLPDTQGNMVFGLVTYENNIHYNPIYLVVKNGLVLDVLPTYEFSRIETLVNKTCYIDENYIWHVKTFRNIDGFEVETVSYERYKISDDGKFNKIKGFK